MPVEGRGYPPFPLSYFEHNDCPLRGGEYPSIPLKKILLKSRLFRSKNSIFCLFYAFIALFGPLYGLFGPFLTLFNEKTSFLALLGKNFPEKLSGLSVKGGGVPPLSAKEKNLLFFRLIFR